MTYAEEMLQHKAVELTVLDQMPDPNALSPPRWHLLPPTNTCAASYEYLRYLLRVPATNPGLLDFAACSKKHLGYCVVGCFTTAESLSGCHSLPQHDNQVKQWSKRLTAAEFIHFTYRGITSCRKRSVPKIGDIQMTLSGIGSRSTDSASG